MKYRQMHSVEVAAAKASISRATAYRDRLREGAESYTKDAALAKSAIARVAD